MTQRLHDAGPRVEAAIFDCDGTLVDSEELGLEVLAQVAVRLGLGPDLVGRLVSMRGEAMSTCLDFVACHASRPAPPDLEAMVRERMAESFRVHLKPMPGARRLLERLSVPVCIATNGPRSKAELTLGICGLLPLFHGRIFSAYEVGAFKPDPALFLSAAAAMRVAPRACVVVEDSWPGMRAGLAAGMRVYAVRTERVLPADLDGRVHLLERLEDLLGSTGFEAPHPTQTQGSP